MISCQHMVTKLLNPAGAGEPLVRPVRVLGLAHVSTRSTPLNPAACRPAPGAWPQLVHADPDFDTAKCSLDCVEAISDCMLLTPERKAYKPSRVWCARTAGCSSIFIYV